MLKYLFYLSFFGLLAIGCAPPQPELSDGADSTSSASNTESKRPSPLELGEQHVRDPREFLAQGPLKVDVMQLVAPKRSVELTQRLMDAMKRDPDYWRNAVKSAPQGAPLAYDARLGLTESEYAELISYKDKFSAEKKGESSITFISRGRDVYLLSGGLDLPDFDGIVIDLRDDFVKTKYGTLTRGKDINTTEKAALGAWHGTSWTLTQLDPSGSSGINASFALGTLKQSGRNVIYYEATIISPVERTQIHHILYFDNPRK